MIDIKEEETYQKVILKDLYHKYIYYNKKENNKMKIGDIYNIIGNVSKIEHERTPYGFDYYNYLKYQDVLGTLDAKLITFKKNIFTFSKINKMLDNYYDRCLKNSYIIKALTIGVKDDISNELSSNIQMVGISHLFVVSGLHVGIITSILEKILNKTKLNKNWKNIIIYIFLGMYLIITNFLISVMRVTISYILKNILKFNYTSLDRMSINIILILALNPYYIFSYSFILTYLISSMIVIINPILSKRKGFVGYIINSLIISLCSILVTLPIVVMINSNINLLSIVYNIFFIPFVSYVVLPVSIIISFIPKLEFFLDFIYDIFIILINTLSKADFLTINMSVLSSTEIVIFYSLLLCVIYMLEHRKYWFISIFCIFFLYWYTKPFFIPYQNITFLDLSVGDATHIQDAFNKKNIIIDTGVSSDDTIVSYLKKKGIRTIDLIIISHGDDDHNGNLIRLINNFNVKGVILSIYDYNTYKLLVDNDYYKFKLVKRNDYFKLGNIQFNIIWPEYDMNDVNNNSLVFIMNLNNIKFLFTGDIEKKAEEELIKYEGKINVDILKIAHHASNTSTHEKWLEAVSFNIGVAMTGSKNTYGFPNEYTVKRLKNKTIYYTNECYSITFYKLFFKKKFKVRWLNK